MRVGDGLIGVSWWRCAGAGDGWWELVGIGDGLIGVRW